jgi:aminoglycoside 3-N-acetyltransferase
MVNFRELVTAFRKLELPPGKPVVAHASLSAFGQVQGGAQTLLGALTAVCASLVMPAFTYKTMVCPGTGPANNGLSYGTRQDSNRMALIFHPDMPADRLIGVLSEALRRHPQAQRSLHPILSFTGLHAQAALEAQTYLEPLGTIRVLDEQGGWVLLLGVNHTVNTSIHYAECLAGRKQFVRWALTQHGVRECPGFPGCSDGFAALAPFLEGHTRRAQVGSALVQAVSLAALIKTVRELIASDPLALLCTNSYCERCESVRNEVGG